MIFFALKGQITINSVIGIVSFVIATLILVYVSILSIKSKEQVDVK